MTPIYGFICVPHLGGITVHYALGAPYNPSKPSALLIPGFMTTLDLFEPQFNDKDLLQKVNLVAVDPLGHGKTKGPANGHWTYWDNAIVMQQVMEALSIEKWWVVGTAQGGWIAPRMALLAGDKIRGIVIMGTSQDSESAASREVGCWDGNSVFDPLISAWSTPPSSGEEWTIPEEFVETIIKLALGETFGPEKQALWKKKIMEVYKGEEGRKKALMCAICLRDRDSLQARLGDVKCPVIWCHGTADPVFSIAHAQREIKLFTSCPHARLEIIDQGSHYMSATHPDPIKKGLLGLIAVEA